ncbi:MAG: hypothetical protein H5T49_04605 [Hadesarchaea archaeon]|nr:hypothetical protein [Hadesarchaea archaeon]
MKRGPMEVECAICGRTFRTHNPRSDVCFDCVPPMDPLERKALGMLERKTEGEKWPKYG